MMGRVTKGIPSIRGGSTEAPAGLAPASPRTCGDPSPEHRRSRHPAPCAGTKRRVPRTKSYLLEGGTEQIGKTVAPPCLAELLRPRQWQEVMCLPRHATSDPANRIEPRIAHGLAPDLR